EGDRPYADSIDRYVAGTIDRAPVGVAETERPGPVLIHLNCCGTAGDVVGEIHVAGPDEPKVSCFKNVPAALRAVFGLVAKRGCSDINESTPGVRSSRDSIGNYVFRHPERCRRSGLGQVNSEKRPSTDPNELISSVGESVDIQICRR